jgi:hypothetical protein
MRRFLALSTSASAATPAGAAKGGVLQLSVRRIRTLVAYCALYEFEDVVGRLAGAERLEVEGFSQLEAARRLYKLGRLASGSARIGKAMASIFQARRLDRSYDLFFPMFNGPFELFALASVSNWRERCGAAVCYINELWGDDLPEYLLELLSKFDRLYIGQKHMVPRIAGLLPVPCAYLPMAVDAVAFAPIPQPQRTIGVCNIGRRSSVTHDALVRLAEQRRLFYYYDTVRASGRGGKQITFSVPDPEEHRMLYAALLQRSRYFVANRARVNEPETIGGAQEISARFYEGAAAGVVLLGDAPRSEEFQRQFDWPDAVIHVPFDSPDIGAILERLDSDPARIQRIRVNNVSNAALRHDWLYRLETVFQATGLAPTAAMSRRRTELLGIAEAMRTGAIEAPANAFAAARPTAV